MSVVDAALDNSKSRLRDRVLELEKELAIEKLNGENWKVRCVEEMNVCSQQWKNLLRVKHKLRVVSRDHEEMVRQRRELSLKMQNLDDRLLRTVRRWNEAERYRALYQGLYRQLREQLAVDKIEEIALRPGGWLERRVLAPRFHTARVAHEGDPGKKRRRSER